MSAIPNILSKWVNAKQISIKIVRIDGKSVYVRLMATVHISGNDITYDMFPYYNDFCITGEGATLNLIETKDAFRIKVKITLAGAIKTKKQ